MNPLFLELTGILIAAGLVAYILHFLKQPSIIAYIVTGLLIGPFALYRLQHGDILHGLADIGITLLLFTVGLELDISQLKKIGKAAIWAGLGQILFTAVIGFGIVTLLGFAWLPALYISLALTFSSTIIVVKLLSEKKDMQSLYGKLAVGIFLVQDIAAIIIIIFLAGTTGAEQNLIVAQSLSGNIILTLAKAFMIGVVVVMLSRVVFPKLVRSLQKSDELLLLFSLGWALGLATLFSSSLIGFNPAIGGFVAGLALANTGGHFQISARIKPLRDFFIVIFFIMLGSQLVMTEFTSALVPALILSLFVLIGNPLIITIILGLQGYKVRTSFMTGVTVAQISEFSLILMALGLAAGHVNQLAVTIVTMVGIITIAVSSYGVLYSSKLYEKIIARIAHLLESRQKNITDENLGEAVYKKHIVVVGAHRLGSHIVAGLKRQKEQFIVVDFNPDVVSHYNHANVTAICGDISDEYIQHVAHLPEARMIICTIPDYHDTISLIESLRNGKRKAKLIVTASDEQEAIDLYKQGADYVLLPHFVGGVHLAEIVEKNTDTRSLHKLKARHLKTLHKTLKTN